MVIVSCLARSTKCSKLLCEVSRLRTRCYIPFQFICLFFSILFVDHWDGYEVGDFAQRSANFINEHFAELDITVISHKGATSTNEIETAIENL